MGRFDQKVKTKMTIDWDNKEERTLSRTQNKRKVKELHRINNVKVKFTPMYYGFS